MKTEMLSNRYTHTHTDTQTKYRNPHCAFAPRVNEERLSGTNLSSKSNLPKFQLDVPVVIRAKSMMMIAAFSRNVGKLFSELKLVPDNLLFRYWKIDYM